MSKSKPIIGLTGGIGSGKSSVAQAMAALGSAVFDADEVAQQCLDQSEVIELLVDWWGPEILRGDGKPDRAAIAAHIFDSPEDRQRLEGVIHPMVERARHEFVESASADPAVKAIVLDVPLLLEVGLGEVCDRIWFVEASESDRISRVAKRGWDRAELAKRENNQWALDKKRKSADDIICNSTSVADCQKQTADLLGQIVELP